MARAKTKTQKLRQLVTREIRELEKRGYRFDTDLKESIKSAKFGTLNSLRRGNYANLYAKATAESEGDIISGTERRKQERSESARKGAETRKAKDYEDQDWERSRREQDAVDYGQASYFDEGEIIYARITNLIDSYPTKGSQLLEKALEREIRKYGRNNVLQSMESIPDEVIQTAEEIIHYGKKSDEIARAFRELFGAITGVIQSTEEAKEMGDALDELTDFDSD